MFTTLIASFCVNIFDLGINISKCIELLIFLELDQHYEEINQYDSEK